MEITEQSYLNLLVEDQQVWVVEGKYYTNEDLIEEEHKSLIEKVPYYLIYDYIDDAGLSNTDWPGRIIFPDQLDRYLPKKSFIAFGERVKTLYFTDETYTKSIIKVEYTFNRDAEGYLKDKIRTIFWKKSDETWCPKKKVLNIPVSSETEKQREIKIRRRNIIDGLKGLAGEMNITDRILELFALYQSEEALYVESGNNALYNAIQNDVVTTWLDSPLPNGLIARIALLLHLQHGIVS